MKKKLLGILVCCVLMFGITGCGKSNLTENTNKDKLENNTFKVDYVSLSFAGTYDVVGNGITNERYFKLNPNEKEENLKDNDKVVLFVFASLSALDKDEKDLYMPKSIYNSYIPANELDLNLYFSENPEKYYPSSYESNDYQYKLTNLWPKYKGGRNFDDGYVLYAGSSESVYIVGQYSVKYHDIKETIKNDSTVTLKWSDKYETSFSGKDIDKSSSINDIQINLKNKRYIE